MQSLTFQTSVNNIEISDDQTLLELAKRQQSNESKVGKILSESTQKAVILLVLSMLLSAAALDLQLYITEPPPYEIGLKVISQCRSDLVCRDVAFKAYMDSWKDDPSPLL